MRTYQTSRVDLCYKKLRDELKAWYNKLWEIQQIKVICYA